jgi:hypothetical protein
MRIKLEPFAPVTSGDEPLPPSKPPERTFVEPEPEPNAFSDELRRTLVSLAIGNDNLLAALGVFHNGDNFFVGDDSGMTHSFEARVSVIDPELARTIGLQGSLFTQPTGNTWRSQDGRIVVEQEPVEITRLFFEVRPRRDGNYFAYGAGAGLRNAFKPIPGLAAWQQNAFHRALDTAPVFENRNTEGATLFVDATAIAGRRETKGNGSAFAEASLTASTDPRAIHAAAIVGAELRFSPLILSASQSAALFTQSKFAFETRFGMALDLDPVLLGVELAVPNNHAPNRFARFTDRDPILGLKVEVSL